MNVTTFGLDLEKRVMQVHWVDGETGEICRQQVKRGQLLEFFARRAPAVIAMEACGSAHYWGHKLTALGHQVRLIAAQFVRPFVKTNKTINFERVGRTAHVYYTGFSDGGLDRDLIRVPVTFTRLD